MLGPLLPLKAFFTGPFCAKVVEILKDLTYSLAKRK